MRQSLLGAFLFFFAFGLSACGGGEHDDESPSATLDLLPPSAVRLDELVPGSRLAAGDQHSALIGENARINVWGNNQHGQRGIGSKQLSEYSTPSSQIFITNVPVAELALGSAHTMALDEAGVVWSWGLNEHGQLGVDSLVIEFESPQKVRALSGKKIVRIAAGDANGLALDEHGALFAWGWNGWGQIGDGTKSASIGRIGDKLKPVQVKLGALNRLLKYPPSLR